MVTGYNDWFDKIEGVKVNFLFNIGLPFTYKSINW